jgi:N-acetyl-anhydromuramyl-L-alanine amidase AmpD
VNVDRLSTPHFEVGRGGLRPRAVVVHTNVGSFESTALWFAHPESRVSAHYLVGLDGRVAQFVDEADTARHAGRVHEPTAEVVLEEGGNPNAYTIGIEFEDGGEPERVDRTAEQYAAGAALLAAVTTRWEVPLHRGGVIGHREVYSLKSCPGNLDIDRLIAEAGS